MADVIPNSIPVKFLITGVVAGFVVLKGLRRSNNWKHSNSVMEQLEEDMFVATDRLRDIRDDFVKQMLCGLRGEKSSLYMLPSMVDFLPTGHEQGQFFALDIGGSNFRVLFSKLSDQEGAVEEVKAEECAVPLALRKAEARTLFDFMAKAVVEFAKKNNIPMPGPLSGEKAVVGFCFSFPVNQSAVNRGTIIKWTKGFEITGSQGVDLVQLLESSFVRCGVAARVLAMTNDTVATLLSVRYGERDTWIGLIQGTGVNACYVEQIHNIHTLPAGYVPHGPRMIINSECGNYNSALLPRLDEDVWLDCATDTPGEMVLEKMTSGLYMGEIARRLILRLAEQTQLLEGAPLPRSLQMCGYQLTTPLMAEIDADQSPGLQGTADIMHHTFGISPSALSFRSRQHVQRVCQLVAIRSARLLAAAVAGFLRQLGRDGSAGPPQRTVVAVDGSTYCKYKRYREAVREALVDILGQEVSDLVEMRMTVDGSSLGAAHLAAAFALHTTQD